MTIATMSDALPPNLVAQRDALIAEIHEAFHNVTREGGTSWTEARVLDDNIGLEECPAARASDRETGWEQLIDDPRWQPDPGFGGFCFVDPIGFRYYIAPAMIRIALHAGDIARTTGVACCLGCGLASLRKEGKSSLADRFRAQWQLIDPRQGRCIAHFVQYMIAVDRSEPVHRNWSEALDEHWSQFLPSGTQ